MGRVPDRLLPRDSLLLVVDYQDKLLPAIHEADACVAAARKLIDAARVLDVPMLITEQYPAGLGHTCAVLGEALAGVPVVEKILFSACVPEVLNRLTGWARPNIIVIGIEAHVCVQQSVLDLLRLGYTVHLCADATGSRRPSDRDLAIARMRQAGAIVTSVESAIFELLGQAGTDAFKRVLKIVK
ncbi:MAG: hydrolase [Phycisphaerae bacterium]|nr:hydrolase [Phycisphaerae bacterium]